MFCKVWKEAEEVKSKEDCFTYRQVKVMTGRPFTSVPIRTKAVDIIIFAVYKMK